MALVSREMEIRSLWQELSGFIVGFYHATSAQMPLDFYRFECNLQSDKQQGKI